MVNANISMDYMITTIKECRSYPKTDKILTATKVYYNNRYLKDDIEKV